MDGCPLSGKLSGPGTFSKRKIGYINLLAVANPRLLEDSCSRPKVEPKLSLLLPTYRHSTVYY